MKPQSITTILIIVFAQFSFNAFAQIGPPRPFTFRQNISYRRDKAGDLQLDFYQGSNTSEKQPVVFWITNKIVKKMLVDKLITNGKFPTPISFYIGYNYAIVSLEVYDSD